MGLAVSIADKAKVQVKSVAIEEEAKPVASKQVAQDRQDSYSSPQAPVVDTYGSPVAPPKDTYGSPAADPIAPAAPVQGDVGTQGYYYYYYPVANSHQQTYQSSSPSKSDGGLLGGSNIGLILALGLGLLVVVAVVVMASSRTTTTGRNFLSEYNTDRILFGLLEAYELYTAK